MYKRQCTINALIKEVLNTFEMNNYAQATLCNLSKALTVLITNNLILNLKCYGTTETPLNCFQTYLNNW